MYRFIRAGVRTVRSRALAYFLFGTGERIVHGGPFAGLKYPTGLSAGSEWLPKLVGTYELELHNWVKELPSRNYQTIINVGSGEGYYAVGLAVTIPTVTVYASDVNEDARRFCRRLAEVNRVEGRVHVIGECTIEGLGQLIQGRTLIVCDCEGCEYELLRPDTVRQLRQCDIIVELHRSDPDDDAPAMLLDRFKTTHRVRWEDFGQREIDDVPLLNRLPRRFRAYAVDENRSRGLSWAFLESHEST
jgi:hypothetical protein